MWIAPQPGSKYSVCWLSARCWTAPTLSTFEAFDRIPTAVAPLQCNPRDSFLDVDRPVRFTVIKAAGQAGQHVERSFRKCSTADQQSQLVKKQHSIICFFRMSPHPTGLFSSNLVRYRAERVAVRAHLDLFFCPAELDRSAWMVFVRFRRP